MDSFLALSALGKDRPGLVSELSRAIRDAGCNIRDSRMIAIGGEFALVMLLSGNWDAIAKIETTLPRVAAELDLEILSRRTEARKTSTDLLPYTIDVVSIDHPGVVHDVADFFSSQKINIEDLYTGSYAAAHTGSPMFSLHMTVSIPAHISIAALRSDFMDFCDSLNLDAVMEPAK